MFRKCLLIAATALSLPLSQAMAAGEQLQLIQDAEQLKTALAGEPVVLTTNCLGYYSVERRCDVPVR